MALITSTLLWPPQRLRPFAGWRRKETPPPRWTQSEDFCLTLAPCPLWRSTQRGGMDVVLVSSLLGALVLQVAPSEETLKVSVWPPGSKVFLGESVLLLCTVESGSGFQWSFNWSEPAANPDPRHRVSGDSYFIAAVTREDAGAYRCRADGRRSGAPSVALLAPPAVLSVSGRPPPSLLTPSSRQLFRGEVFTVRCPPAWKLKTKGSKEEEERTLTTSPRSPAGGAVAADDPGERVLAAAGGGLYWCEGAGGRSDAVHIAVSDGGVVLQTPAVPVVEGDKVVLRCRYRAAAGGGTTFFRNGVEVVTFGSSGSDAGVNVRMENVRMENVRMENVAMENVTMENAAMENAAMENAAMENVTMENVTMENVTRVDEGFYKCATRDGSMESPESWLSVRPGPGLNSTSTDGAGEPWKWILVSCGLSLLLVPLLVCLVRHRCRRRLPSSRQKLQGAELPATKPDASEVQWDLSWMEMSDLLDEHSLSGTQRSQS
uniref:Ig-like domain-containing protein n=1 Tax=Gasterosteus aculeatus aculeatus TaxID=481459 RepID=A0AAQ4PED6_GASAC